MPWKFCTEYSWACTQMMFSFNLAPPQLSICTSLYHSVSPLGLLPPTSPVITLYQSSGHPIHFRPRSILSPLPLHFLCRSLLHLVPNPSVSNAIQPGCSCFFFAILTPSPAAWRCLPCQNPRSLDRFMHARMYVCICTLGYLSLYNLCV